MRSLRSISLAGVGIHLLAALIGSIPFGPGLVWNMVFLTLLGAAGMALLLLVARESCHRVVGGLDLFVPVGFYFLAKDLLEWIGAAPVLGPILGASSSFTVLAVSYTVSISGTISFVINAVLAGWLTILILDVAAGQTPDPVTAGRRLANQFLRVLVVRLLGIGGTLCVVTGGLAILMMLLPLGVVAGPVAVGILATVILAFNLTFLHVFAAAVADRTSFGTALVTAFRLGLSTWRRTVVPVLLYLLLLGSIPYFSFSWGGGSSNVNVRFHVQWIADFPTSSVWFAKLVALVGVEPIRLATANLEVFLLGVAIVMLLELSRRVDLAGRFCRERLQGTGSQPLPPQG